MNSPISLPRVAPVTRSCNYCGRLYDTYDGVYRRKGRCQRCTREYEKEKRTRQRRARSSAAYQQARKLALQAAGGQCVQCGSIESLETHHAVIRPGEPGDNSLANLVVLCRPCHLAQHRRPIAKPRPRFSRNTLT